MIITVVLTTTVLSYFTNTKWTLFESLPTWEVNDPVSKVFVMDEIPPTAGSLAAGNSTVPNEYLVDPAIDTLLLMMETQDIYLHQTASQPSGIVGSDDIVILKGNFQWEFRNTTSTDRIKGLIWKILQHPDGFTGEILVGDNTQYTATVTSNNSEDTDQTILDVINTFYSKGYPVYLFEWKNIMSAVVAEYSEGDYNDGFTYNSTSKVSYPKFQSPSSNYYISLRYGIWDSTSQVYNLDHLCIIDFPVLKAHGMAGATIAVKNWIGMIAITQVNERFGNSELMHYQYFFGEYALPAKVMSVTYPKLTIVDAEWTNPDRNYGSASINTKMLLGSTDPCAASWYAAKFILTPIAYSPNSTDPDYPSGKYHNNITPWTDCLGDSGFAVTIDSSEISVYDRVGLNTITANIKAFLEGPYNGNGAMTTTLNSNTLIPLNSDDAYATAVYGYTASTVTSIPNYDIVDWVLLELRTGIASGTKVGTRAAFLKSDGIIVDVDGISPVTFTDLSDGDYYVVVRHRNHLAIMTALAIPLSISSALFDMTTSSTQAYGIDPQLDLGGGYYGMYAADGNKDGGIYGEDYILYQTSQGEEGYRIEDYNMDGGVYGEDYILYQLNQGFETWVP